MVETERFKTYVKYLDDLMEGGIPKKYVVLVCGSSGSFKSSFSYNIIYNCAKNEHIKSLYITLEQKKDSLIKNMVKFGLDIRNVGNLVTIMDIGKLRKELGEEVLGALDKTWLKSLLQQIKNYKDMLNFDIFVLDSLDALYALTDMKNPRNELFHFFEELRDLELTSLLISEIPVGAKEYGKYGVESFLSDGIIHLSIERIGRSVARYISIVKMRETKHSSDYYPFLVNERGFTIVIK